MVAATSIRNHSANFWYCILRSWMVFLSLISLNSFVRPLLSTISRRNLGKLAGILSLVFRCHLLLHIYIQFRCTLPCYLVKLLLLLDSFLIHRLPPGNIVHVGICGCDWSVGKKLLDCPCLCYLRLAEKCS